MITTDRNEPVGAHVKKTVKEALRKEAVKQNTTMSALVSKILEKELSAMGYDLKES